MFASAGVRVEEGPSRLLRPSSDADVRWRLLRAFETAIDGASSEAMIALHAAVSAFAITERRQRLPPERAVIGLKTLLAGHRKEGWAPSLEAVRDVTRKESLVHAELFRWFVASAWWAMVTPAREAGMPALGGADEVRVPRAV